MPEQQINILRKFSLSRVDAGVLIASFAGSIWFCFAIEMPDLLSDKPGQLTFGAAVFVATFFFVSILGVFAVFGLPAYFVARYFKLNEIVLGIPYGFTLAMIASATSFELGAALPANLVFALFDFGLAGILSAAIFLFVVRLDNQVQTN